MRILAENPLHGLAGLFKRRDRKPAVIALPLESEHKLEEIAEAVLFQIKSGGFMLVRKAGIDKDGARIRRVEAIVALRNGTENFQAEIAAWEKWVGDPESDNVMYFMPEMSLNVTSEASSLSIRKVTIEKPNFEQRLAANFFGVFTGQPLKPQQIEVFVEKLLTADIDRQATISQYEVRTGDMQEKVELAEHYWSIERPGDFEDFFEAYFRIPKSADEVSPDEQG